MKNPNLGLGAGSGNTNNATRKSIIERGELGEVVLTMKEGEKSGPEFSRKPSIASNVVDDVTKKIYRDKSDVGPDKKTSQPGFKAQLDQHAECTKVKKGRKGNLSKLQDARNARTPAPVRRNSSENSRRSVSADRRRDSYSTMNMNKRAADSKKPPSWSRGVASMKRLTGLMNQYRNIKKEAPTRPRCVIC
jgi:hypothetical protein